ncbi:MAG: urea transporter [Magnetococcales bacterium]|nr:urea transporter [Magnetococcales bacterium]
MPANITNSKAIMDNRCSNSFAADAWLLIGTTLTGMAQLALCRSRLVGLVLCLCVAPFSWLACGLSLLGALVATLWPLWRQRDVRLLATGWYGVNGALCGFVVEWHFAQPLEAVVLTVLGAWVSALLLDLVVYRLGDAPVSLPPLTIPFVLVAILLTLAMPRLYAGLEQVQDLLFGQAILAAPRSVPVEGVARMDSATIASLEKGWKIYDAGLYRHAREVFLTLAEVVPGQAALWNGVGWSELRLGHVAEAGQAFGQALRLDPRHLQALDGQGWTMYLRGRYGEADRLFQRAVDLDPHFADALNGLGWIALRHHEAGRSVQLFSSALAHGSNVTSAREGLGRALLASQRRAESEAVFVAMLEESGSRVAAIKGLADVRRALMLHGERMTVDAREWQAVVDFMGWRVWVVLVIAGAVLVSLPWAAVIALTLMALGMALTSHMAGPGSLLWIDCHLQTVALIGLLMGEARYRSRIVGLLVVVGAVLTGLVVWALLHRLGFWIPLASFNVAGLLWKYGAVLRSKEEKKNNRTHFLGTNPLQTLSKRQQAAGENGYTQ